MLLSDLRVSVVKTQVAALTLLAFALRMWMLAGPVPRWDEGWTIAHASLGWPELLQISAAEWHPPLYYIFMKLWLTLGPGTLIVRYPSVLFGTLAVPVAYQVGRLWDRSPRTGVLAALLCAWFPLLVYYGQVARMYPLATLFVMLAAWALLAGTGARGATALALCTFLAASTQYYTAWPLAALYVYGALVNPRRIGTLVAAGAGAVALYVPWLLYAYPALTARLATGTGRGIDPLAGTLAKLPLSLGGLLLYTDDARFAPAALALVLLAGAVLGLRRRVDLVALSLPLMAVVIPVVGIAYGAQASGWTAPHRHMMLAAGLALLGVAWALNRLAARHVALALGAFALVALAYAPTSLSYIYAKNLEVVDPFDPAIDEAYLHAHARADELVFFNVLARAGWYENHRLPGDPAWSYAMRWDPIVEPLDTVTARVQAAAQTHPRVWFVMHEGAYGANGPLVDWLDANLYPSVAEWRTDPPMTHTLYLAYAVPDESLMTTRDGPLAAGPVNLARARYAPNATPGAAVAVELQWSTDAAVPADYTVYVHWTDDTGAVVAQHDGVPAAGRRPTSTWARGETVVDRHAARLPAGWQGRLYVVVGWYNPVTGERAGEPLELGLVEVP
jgi:hypothetical protein